MCSVRVRRLLFLCRGLVFAEGLKQCREIDTETVGKGKCGGEFRFVLCTFDVDDAFPAHMGFLSQPVDAPTLFAAKLCDLDPECNEVRFWDLRHALSLFECKLLHSATYYPICKNVQVGAGGESVLLVLCGPACGMRFGDT